MFNQTKLFTHALGLQEPCKVEKTIFDTDSGKLDMYLTWQSMSKFACPECQKLCAVHDSKERTWRHLNFFQYQAFIHCSVPRIKCNEHKMKGKGHNTVKAFVDDLSEHNGNAEQIENVSCDMSNSFIKGVGENLQNAKITFDKFHVMKMVNAALDKVRKMELVDNSVLKKSRYVWPKNPQNRTKKQSEMFTSLSK